MNLKKLKIIYFPQKKLIIFSFVFLAVLFFQINQAKAVATCSWLYPESGGLFANKTCAGLQLGDKIDPPNADCANVTKPSACDWPTTIENNPCLCCCKTTAPTINDTMPKWTNPLDNLQVKIPGLIFTKSNEIKCEEQNGKKICNFPWIGEYIAGIYKYAIGIVGILAAVVLMIGGVIWIMAGGSATMIGEAKAWIGASLTGLVIALCSYVILYQVNPALVGFKGLEIQLVDQIPVPPDVKAFAEKCKPTNSGECAVSKMTIFRERAQQASAICMAESSGVSNAKNTLTKCSNGDYYAVWGLFQFNLSANKFYDGSTTLDCPASFGNKAWVNSSPTCTITNPALYQQCVNAASNPNLSRINAQKLVTTNSWGPWEANSKWCKF